ncbi:MAG: L-rhamnose mutarotase [Bacteroidaceae bacterium]|jgi:L-rhamnose mutarotase|nr:L-rhamnose mutarotase [Bacteroidaceae bacterium]
MEPTNGYPQKVFHRPVKRWVQTMDLRDNPQLIAEYRRRHSRGEVWPEVLQGIRDCGLLEMEIYILGTRLVMICEAPLDVDWDEAMRRMASGPRQAEWEAFMAVFQQCDPGQTSDEKWQMMERMFHVYE